MKGSDWRGWNVEKRTGRDKKSSGKLCKAPVELDFDEYYIHFFYLLLTNLKIN
jgi:hypothetical protein